MSGLAALRSFKQFITYKVVPKANGKSDKLPCDWRTGVVIDAQDPQYWTDYDTAVKHGPVGFVITKGCKIFCLDIDGCLLPDGSGWSQIALELHAALPGCAIEISQSGKGWHIWGVYSEGLLPHSNRNAQYGIELYTEGRFIAMSDKGVSGAIGSDCTAYLNAVIAKYFTKTQPVASIAGPEWTSSPREDWRGPESDEDLIRRAMRSQSSSSAFGGKASFADLWNCNIEALSRTYPDAGRAYNESQADAALAQHLAFWTGNNCERIERLMMQSKLVRDKWNREDYIERTILNAVSQQFDTLTDRTFELPSESPVIQNEPVRPSIVQGSTFATNEDQLKLFAGCVYVQDMHRVLVPGGNLLKPDQFKVMFGGYTFTTDAANEKTTRDAWEAFTQNQAFRCPKADTTCFKPDLQPGVIIERDGVKYANTYWPVEVKRKVGDASRIFDHMQRVIPDEHERMTMLYYMAACVQHQGKKFQWAPLLQGVEGNGKSLFSRYVANAIGKKYVHWPKASQIANNFNGWLVGRTFFAVEDIYVPGERAEIIEILKPMITGGDGLEIERKGVDQISSDICGNFIFNSNHKDAVRKGMNDRRFCMIFTAQQSKEDLVRDGMTGAYFPDLYDWLREEGYEIMAELLHTLPIPDEFNPATKCQYAPETRSTKAAIDASMGGIEQEIIEAIEQGLPGFCGGWVSSIMLDRLLEKLGLARRITHYKRKEMLYSMGYEYHPALHDGRVNNIVLPDNSKPRLFIKKDSAARNIATAADAGRAYEKDNNLVSFMVK